jgi:uncharacterized protein
VKEQLLLLIEVQRHDARIQELDGMKKVWPTKLEALENDLKKVGSMLDKERAQLEETESWRRRQEAEMKDEESALLKAKQKSGMVKNTKEMMANERELQATRKMAQEREEEVLKLVGAVETAKKSIAQHEADFEALKKHVEGERASAQTEMAKFDAQIADERKLREEAAARVRPDVFKKYASIRMKRGLALVAVKNGTCQGCNMNIPPQLFNTIQRGNSVELCGNCNRIIYWDKLLEEGDGKPPTT